MATDDNPISEHPEQDSILTTALRNFLDTTKNTDVSDNTRYTYRKRIKSRIQAGMWDFGLLLWSDEEIYDELYDGPVPDHSHRENPDRMPLEGFSDHAANVIGFLYLALPYPAFIQAIQTGINRAEREGNERRIITTNVEIDRTFAPTEENADKYNVDELRKKLTSGEELTELERVALARELSETSREVAEREKTFSHRSDN